MLPGVDPEFPSLLMGSACCGEEGEPGVTRQLVTCPSPGPWGVPSGHGREAVWLFQGRLEPLSLCGCAAPGNFCWAFLLSSEASTSLWKQGPVIFISEREAEAG